MRGLVGTNSDTFLPIKLNIWSVYVLSYECGNSKLIIEVAGFGNNLIGFAATSSELTGLF
ncbi:MAG: hypothetical protein JWP81_1683 [Ferruginibacter sp.]|nr:hypothetical protein [Ferruginibacter sp.]